MFRALQTSLTVRRIEEVINGFVSGFTAPGQSQELAMTIPSSDLKPVAKPSPANLSTSGRARRRRRSAGIMAGSGGFKSGWF